VFINGCMDKQKVAYMYKMVFYSAIIRNKVQVHAATCKIPENNILGKKLVTKGLIFCGSIFIKYQK
jgi:hypothetical protein